MNRLILFLSAFALLVSCSKIVDHEKPSPVIVAQNSSTSSSSAGVFMQAKYRNGDSVVIFNNENFTASGNKLISDKNIYIPSDADSLLIISYQPYSKEVDNPRSFFAYAPTDQNVETQFLSTEVLVARDTLLDPSNSFNLTFEQVFTEVLINLETKDNLTEEGDCSVEVYNVPNVSTLDLTTSEMEILLYSNIDAYVVRGTGNTFSARARFLPKEFKGGLLANVSYDGKDFPVKVTQEIPFLAGKRYVINAVIENADIEVNDNIEIEDWNVISDIEGDLDIDQGAQSVTDADGNKYDYAQFGPLYWMLQNLRVTRYIDGTPITYFHDTDLTPWTSVSTGMYCCYDNADPASSKDHFLYNYYAAETGKLCPEGWRIPTLDEWISLGDIYGGQEVCAPALKSATGWYSEGNGTNESGMNIYPIGFIDIAYKSAEKYAYLWTSTPKDGDDTKVRAAILSYNNDQLKSWSWGASKTCGFSVRCVKEAE